MRIRDRIGSQGCDAHPLSQARLEDERKVPVSVPAKVRHPLFPGTPKRRLAPTEYERLRSLLRTPPGPTPWYATGFPPLRGPSNLTLVWRELRGPKYATVTVPEGEDGPAFVAMGFHCYVFRVASDQILVWHHAGPPARPDAVKVVLVNTTELRPLQDIPILEMWEVRVDGGVVATVDLPVSLDQGRHEFDFPESMHAVPPFLMLVHTRPPGKSLPRGLGHIEAIYDVEPRAKKVEVVPLDWWNSGDFDFGYEWITQVARDPQTKMLVGDGFRIFPFLATADGKFVSWIEEAK